MAVKVFRAAAGVAGKSSNAKRCALLLGWTGGSLRHVAKHSEMWNNLGTSSVAAAVTLRETFLPRTETGLRDKARELLDAATLELRAEEIVAHCFSNGGCLLYLTVLEELEVRRRGEASGENVPAIVGTIYDSCPNRSVYPAHGPFLVTLATPLPWREKLAVLRDLVPYAVSSTVLHPFRGNPMGWFGGLRDPEVNPVDKPELVMYSGGDRLIPVEWVEDFASLRESQGATVTRHRFPDDSPHVQHYRMRPEEYQEVVSEWLGQLTDEPVGSVRSRL